MTIPELGDAIAALTLSEAVELRRYIESRGGDAGACALVPVGPRGPFHQLASLDTPSEMLPVINVATWAVLDEITAEWWSGSTIQGDNSTDKASRGKGVGDYRL